MTDEKLRLGGMALRNGLLVHGPTHWAAAVRDRHGVIHTASGPKPKLTALDGVPGLRGVARLGEAMAVIPLVRRALPQARLPFEHAGVAGAGAHRGGPVRRPVDKQAVAQRHAAEPQLLGFGVAHPRSVFVIDE